MEDDGFDASYSSPENFNILKSQIPVILSINLKEENIIVSAKPQLSNNIYSRAFSLEDLFSTHEFFEGLESLDKIHDFLLERAGEDEVSVNEDSDPLVINFHNVEDFSETKIPLSLGKVNQENVDCSCNLTDITDRLNALSDIIKFSEKKVDEMEDKVKESGEKTSSIEAKVENSDAKVLVLEEKLNDLHEKNSLLEEKIKQVEEINSELKCKIEISDQRYTNLEEKLKLSEEKNSILAGELMSCESKYYYLEDMIKKYDSKFEKSIENSQLINEDEIEVLRTWISEGNNKNVNFKLLFRSSVHGRTGRDFHRKCDNRGHTITIIKATNGMRFGGYTTLLWEPSSGTWKGKDPNAFIFSLDKKLKLTCNDQDYVIHNNSEYGPIFGAGFDIMVNTDFSNNCSSNTPHSYGKSEGVERYCLTGNSYNFTPEEIEVYQII
jgi:hypothetical protein